MHLSLHRWRPTLFFKAQCIGEVEILKAQGHPHAQTSVLESNPALDPAKDGPSLSKWCSKQRDQIMSCFVVDTKTRLCLVKKKKNLYFKPPKWPLLETEVSYRRMADAATCHAQTSRHATMP